MSRETRNVRFNENRIKWKMKIREERNGLGSFYLDDFLLSVFSKTVTHCGEMASCMQYAT